MKLVRTLAALAFAAAAPLSAFAATGNLVVSANSLIYKYIFFNNSDAGLQQGSMSVGGLPATNPSGCTYLVLGPTSTNFEEAKLFQAAILQAKTIRANVQLTYNTAGCLISGFQVQPN